MTKYPLIKTICISIFILFPVVFGGFQNAFGESLSGYTANGTASTTSDSFAFGTVTTVNVSTAVNVGDPILVVVTFMTESTGTLNVQKDPEFNLTNTAGTAQNTIYRTLQSVTGGDNDRGIGSIVNVYNAATTTPTYYFQHRVSTAGNQIQTKATIVAIPLNASPSSTVLASNSDRASAAVAAPATPTEVTGTSIAVDTLGKGFNTSPGAYYVAASVETYSTSISGTGNTGEWQLQYRTSGAGTWNNLGYPVQRNIKKANHYGISNLVALLPNQTPAANYEFRLVHHKVSGATDIFTANINIMAIFTGINVSGSPLQFPTYETQSPLVATSSTTPVEAIGFDFVPVVNSPATTSLFMHAQYWMSTTGKDYAYYDLSLNGTPLTFNSQQLDRYLPAGLKGSGASVGLASGLLEPNIYRVSLRHSHDATGQTITTQNPWLVMIDLNTASPSPDLSVSKVCADLIPGQNDALIYTITISNIGAESSPVSSLSNTIPTGTGGDLTDVKYVIDAGIPPAAGTPWPATNTINLPSIAPGDSLAVRIYADVPYALTGIGGNTATVTLASDSDNSNNDNTNPNGTCSTSLATSPTSPRALSFDSNDGTDDYVSITDDDTLDLSTSGTLEAWIYMTGTVDGAGIIHKGNGSTNEAYSLRFGLGTQNDQVQLVVNNGTADILTSDTNLNPVQGMLYKLE